MNILKFSLTGLKRNPTDEYVERGIRPGSEFRVGAIDANYPLAPVKKVALLTEAFLPKIDGVSKTTVLVARHLQNTGREVMIFAPDFHTPSHLGESEVVRVPALPLPFVPETRMGLPLRRITTRLHDFQPDLIHLFSPTSLCMPGVWYASRQGIPLVATYQTDLPGYMTQYGFPFFHGIVRGILRMMHNRADVNLAPTHSVIRQLQAWGFQRLHLWGRGVDHVRFNPARRSEEMRLRMLAGRAPEHLLVLYAGRLAAEKRVDLLKDIAAVEGAALTIVGDGAQRSELESLFGKNVHFMGYLFGDELATAYASADVFAFTGTHETFGQVVLEAMSSGLPALVPNSGGVVDLILDGINGYVCQVHSADYRQKVIYLRDNPRQRNRMRQLAREYACQRPWERLMEQLEDYYMTACMVSSEKSGIALK